MTDFVIIPAYNEEKYIKEVIRNTKKYAKNIIVVDDGSNDDTSAIAEEENVIVLRHNVNLGKGAALKTGCDYALKSEAENIVVIDADGQHNPEKIDTFRKEISGNDIVFGYRELSKSMPFVLRFGNLVINEITSVLYGMKLKDTQCGYRAFTAEAYKKIRWQSSDYSMESEMIANAGKHHLKYKEVPIKTIYGDKYKGTTVIDGIKIVLKMFTWRLFK
jgi:UDP-N-acetylglucosamine---dolichyl-phosphate N-acetylglucosaminyltransferase